ncbi:SDR family NAD(P)-dependent oxidoreductase [Tropicimonas marinistellae]|uniref:SDR family NAD(P)-dependent oxidoreductase n=1 Tax=Tropicimonas marinistellae TaxID=1739787 RepID=UPI000832F14F|nr:SDR family NAD(P)-dependent oxidoreductase [Tropicimonas marinistellae]
MKTALVIGASGGIGAAMTTSLSGRGVDVTGVSRSVDGLDVTDQGSVDRVLGALHGPFDFLFVASGVLAPNGAEPEKSLGQISAAQMAHVLAVNTIGPAMILRHAPRLLPRKGRSVLAVLTARVGSIGDNQLGGWYSYRASKAAANQIVRTAAIEIGRSHREAAVIALHPGTVATPFTENYPGHRKVAPAAAAENLLRVIDGVGPEHSGRFFDWAGEEVPW